MASMTGSTESRLHTVRCAQVENACRLRKRCKTRGVWTPPYDARPFPRLGEKKAHPWVRFNHQARPGRLAVPTASVERVSPLMISGMDYRLFLALPKTYVRVACTALVPLRPIITQLCQRRIVFYIRFSNTGHKRGQ